MPNLGPIELLAILVVVALVFGPKRLPGLGRSLGTGVRELKEGLTLDRPTERNDTADVPARVERDRG